MKAEKLGWVQNQDQVIVLRSKAMATLKEQRRVAVHAVDEIQRDEQPLFDVKAHAFHTLRGTLGALQQLQATL